MKKYNKYHKDDISGIYQIYCSINNKSYIGQAYHIWNRCASKHCNMLKKHNHPNKHLQAAFNKYGIENFEWSVIKLCPIDQLNIEEERAIAAIGRENLFNFTDGGEGIKGYKHTEEYKKYDSASKIAGWATGKYTTPEMAIKRINVFTGQEHIYDRTGSAEKDGFSKKTIMSCLCGIKNTHKGFFWCRSDDSKTYLDLRNELSELSLLQAEAYYTFAMQLDGHDAIDLIKTKKPGPKIKLTAKSRSYKPIERINVVTGLVTEYNSIAEASRDGFDRSTIQRALGGKISSYKGYYWNTLGVFNV